MKNETGRKIRKKWPKILFSLFLLCTFSVSSVSVSRVSALPSVPLSDAEEYQRLKEKNPAEETTTENLFKSEEQTSPEEKSGESESENTPFRLNKISVEYEGMKLRKRHINKITKKASEKEITFSELKNTVSELTEYARKRGYPSAFAYIPEQTITDGNLTVRILPGKFGEIAIHNESKMKDLVLRRVAAGLKSGNVIKHKEIESVLYNIDSIGGVSVMGVLSPGKEVGTSNYDIYVKDDDPNKFIAYSENYGNKSAGRYRYGVQADMANVGGTGTRINAGVSISNRHQHNYNISAETPVGHSATTLGVGVSHMDYELGNSFGELGAKGVATTVSVYGTTPLWHTRESEQSIYYGYNHRNIKDEIANYDFSWDKHSNALYLGIRGREYHPGKNNRGTYLKYSVAVHTGTVTPDSDIARLVGELGNTSGRFSKATFDATAIQTLDKHFDILLKASGQISSRNLDSSERFYLGGARGVRAYPQGEASGDEGILGSFELRYHTSVPGLTVSTYYDAGHVKLANDGSQGSETLQGWGIGLTYSRDEFFARIDYARRIGLDENSSKEAQSKDRVWFLAGFNF